MCLLHVKASVKAESIQPAAPLGLRQGAASRLKLVNIIHVMGRWKQSVLLSTCYAVCCHPLHYCIVILKFWVFLGVFGVALNASRS